VQEVLTEIGCVNVHETLSLAVKRVAQRVNKVTGESDTDGFSLLALGRILHAEEERLAAMGKLPGQRTTIFDVTTGSWWRDCLFTVAREAKWWEKDPTTHMRPAFFEVIEGRGSWFDTKYGDTYRLNLHPSRIRDDGSILLTKSERSKLARMERERYAAWKRDQGRSRIIDLRLARDPETALKGPGVLIVER